MSSRIKTITPFINRELLLKALDEVGCRYSISGNEIITDRVDNYYGNQKFIYINGRYVIQHEDSGYSWNSKYRDLNDYLGVIGQAYNRIYTKQMEELEKKRLAAIAEAERLRKEKLAEQERLRLIAIAEEERKRAEEEKQRLERERKEYVERQRAGIIASAKELGYDDIRETIVDNKIKLVLVRNTY